MDWFVPSTAVQRGATLPVSSPVSVVFFAFEPIRSAWEPVMYCRHRLGACASLILAWSCVGVAQQYSFRHYLAADGLQNLVVLSLAQDGAGYIWAGSEGGLYRYDGTRFRLLAAA